MAKKVLVIVDSCEKCPYYREFSDYSGTYCREPRMVGDTDGKVLAHDQEMFEPFEEQRWYPFPDWCPLEDE